MTVTLQKAAVFRRQRNAGDYQIERSAAPGQMAGDKYIGSPLTGNQMVAYNGA